MTKRNIYQFAIVLCLTMAFSFMTLTAGAVVDQPFMKAARNDLNKAQNNLRKATADKGGHRARAMQLVEQAITKVNQGIAYDRNNPKDRRPRRNSAEPENIFNETGLSASSDQPFMQKAKDNLKDALNNLERATADKGGFRAQALSLVREAIDEVNKGIDYDRRN